MKNNIFILLLFGLISAFIWAGCDKIDDKLVITDQQLVMTDGPDSNFFLDPVYFLDTMVVNRKQVLLEDFTGHLCTNCPEAAIASHGWAEENDHQLIIYSIHAGNFAGLNPDDGYVNDYTTPTGNTLFADFQVWGNPTAMIDRVLYNSVQVLPFGFWEDAMNQRLTVENVIDLSLVNIYYPNLETLEIRIEATILQALQGNYKLAVILVEDGIISPQKNEDPDLGPSPDWVDYEHHNILRDAVNGTYGNYFSENGEVEVGETYSASFLYDEFNAEWVTANLNVIAYIYNEETFEVLQVAELGVKTEE